MNFESILKLIPGFVRRNVANDSLPLPRIVDRVSGGVPEGAEPIYADIVVFRNDFQDGPPKVEARVSLNTDTFTPENVEIISAVVRHANDHARMLIRRFETIFADESSPLRSVPPEGESAPPEGDPIV